MKLKDPHELLAAIDLDRWDFLRGASKNSGVGSAGNELKYVEPYGSVTVDAKTTQEQQQQTESLTAAHPVNTTSLAVGHEILSGKINRLGDYVDTDAVCIHFYFCGLLFLGVLTCR